MSRHFQFFVGFLALHTTMLMLSVQSTSEPQGSEDTPAIGAFGRSALDGPGAASPPAQRSFPWDQETDERPSRRRSLEDLDLKRKAPLQARIRRHSMPGRLPPRAAEQEQLAPKKKRGRIQRVRRALRRALRRAKLRLQRAWRAVKERARRVKAGIRRGAARVYAKMPRAFWRRGRAGRRASLARGQQPPPAEGEGPQGAAGGQVTAEGEAGEGAQAISPVPPPKPPRTFMYRGPLERSVKGAEEGGALSPEAGRAFPFPPVQEEFDVPDAGLPTPPELKKGGPGEAEQGELSEASTEAPGVEETLSDEELFFTPPSSPTVTRRSPDLDEILGAGGVPSIEEKAPTAAASFGGEEEEPSAAGGEEEEAFTKEFEGLAIPPPEARERAPVCGMWSDRISSALQPVVDTCPDLCALWTLFSRPGRLSQSASGMPPLAAQLASTISVGRDLVKEGRAGEPGTEKLLLGMRIGEAEDKVVRAVDETDMSCWYTNVSGVFNRANEDELRVLQQASGSLSFVFRNIDDFVLKMQRLLTLAVESQPACMPALQKELQEEEEKARRLSEGEEGEDSSLGSQAHKLSSDLRLLRLREFCSMEMIYRIEIQSISIMHFISDYTGRTRKWWKPEWLSKTSRLRFPPKGAPGVPAEIAQECRSFEAAELPTSIGDVHPFTLWMWEQPGAIKSKGQKQARTSGIVCRRTPARFGWWRAARMNVGAHIFGAHFGAYSFKNYLPVIAAVIVAAVVGEIAHNAKVKRQRREQNERIAKLRQLVRKQKLKRDIALIDAEREEIAAMERRANAKRLLYRPEEIDRPVWQQRPRTRNPGVSVLDELSFEDDYYPAPLPPHQLRYPRTPKDAALLQKGLTMADRRRRRTLGLRADSGDKRVEEKDEISRDETDAPAEAETPAEDETDALAKAETPAEGEVTAEHEAPVEGELPADGEAPAEAAASKSS
ncbi:hypothetical protein Emag_005973 [Eimeria magna]